MMTDNTVFMDYENIDQVLAHLDQPKPDGSGSDSRDTRAADSWDLGLGWKGAMAAYTGGWAEGAHRAYELSERLIPRPIGKRTALSRSVTGAFPNVGAYLAGAPNSMYRVSKKQTGTRPYVHLYLPIGYSAFIRAETAFDKGCAMVALVDALETAGCRVKVTLLEMGMYVSQRMVMRFQVKDYGSKLDIDQIIFTAAHPAMLRRIIFALLERSPYAPVRQTTRQGGYGRPVDAIEAVDTVPDGNAIRVILPRLTANGGTPETFLAELVASLPADLQTEIQPLTNER